jgi:WD repeat-containing protein 68
MSAPKKEIYTYSAPWPVYSLAASHSQDPRLSHRYCFGSFVEEYSNKLQIIQLDDEKGEFVVRSTMDHPYPATRIQWAPEPLCATRDVLATSGDYLRLWAVSADGEARQECTLNNVRVWCVCVWGGGGWWGWRGGGGGGG